MAKNKEVVGRRHIKPNCEYCINGTDIGNHMSGCLFCPHPRSNGINGRTQCDKNRFEVDLSKYNRWLNKKNNPT